MLPDRDGFVALAVDQLVQVTVVALVVGLLVALFARRRPHLAYLLWLLVIAKCLTPPLVSSPTSVFSWVSAETVRPAPEEIAVVRPAPVVLATPLGAEFDVAPPPAELVVTEALPAEESPPFELPSWSTLLLLGWAVGAVLLALFVVVGWLRLRRAIRASTVETPAWVATLFARVAAELKLRRVPRLVVTSQPLGPCTLGWPRSTIVVPQALVASPASTSTLEHALAHELLHAARGDLAVAQLQLLAQLVWWFHPCVWWANREIRRERERCCDEAVLARLGCPPAAYAATLVSILELRHRLGASAMLPIASATEVNEHRLRHIMRPVARFHAHTPAWCWAVLLVAAMLALPGAGLSLDEPTEDETAAAQATDENPPAEPETGEFPSVRLPPFADSVFIGEEAEAVPLDKLSETHKRATARLRELGANVQEAFYADGKTPYSSVQFFDSNAPDIDKKLTWRGTAEDLRLVADLEHLTNVTLAGGTPALAAQVPVLKDVEKLTLLELRDPTADLLRAVGQLKQLKYLNVSSYSRPGDQLTPVDSSSLADLDQLEQLSVYAMPFDDDALAHVGKLPKLKQLSLDSLPITDRGIESLAGLQHLEILSVRHSPSDQQPETRVTGTGCGSLANLPKLRFLTISGPRISDDGLHAISQLDQLESLIVEEAANTTAEGARSLASLAELQVLVLQGPPLTKDDFARFGQLTKLNTLWLGENIDLGDVGASHLTGLNNLRQLESPGSRLTDRGIAALVGFPELHHLSLPQTEISPAGIEQLAKLPRLVSLTFDGRQVDDAALKILVEKLRLARIVLRGSKVTDEGLAVLGTSPRIRVLDLSETAITDKALDYVARLPKLTDLNLSGTAISDAGMEKLRGLKSLVYLDVTNTKVTGEGVAQLAAALPGLQSLDNDFDPSLSAIKLETFGFEILSEEAEEPAAEAAPDLNDGTALGGGVPVQLDFVGPAPADSPGALPVGSLDQVTIDGPIVGAAEPGVALDSVELEVVGEVQPTGTFTSAEFVPDDPVNTGDKPRAVDPFSDRHKLAAARLRKLGTSIDETVMATPIKGGESVVLDPSWNGSTEELRLAAYTSVMLDGTWKGTSDDLELLADLDGVTQVHLYEPAPAVDAGLDVLEKLQGLISLTISRPRPEALKHVGRLKNLRSLTLLGSGPDDDAPLLVSDFALLADMTNLRRLMLSALPLGDGALLHVAKLRNLEFLMLENVPITDADIFALAPLVRLKELFIVENPRNGATTARFTGVGLAALDKNPALSTLTIVAPALSDDGMRAIGQLGGLHSLIFNGGRTVTADGFAALASLEKLERLVLAGPTLSGDDFAPLAKLPNLQALVLNENADLGDAGARHIAGLSKLKHLDTRGEGLSDEGIAAIAGLSELRYLILPRAQITSAGFQRLLKLPKLVTLEIDARQLDDQALAQLAVHPGIAKNGISLRRAQLTDAGLAALENCPDLGWLNLPHTPISDAGLEHIVRLAKLGNLDLAGTQLTDEGLIKLHELNELEYLDVRQTKVTAAALEQLAKALPKLHGLANDAGFELKLDPNAVLGLDAALQYDGVEDDPRGQ